MSGYNLTPAQVFLIRWTREGRLITDAVEARRMQAHGPRAIKRAARKRRRKLHAARLQRVTWCRHFEAIKREAS